MVSTDYIIPTKMNRGLLIALLVCALGRAWADSDAPASDNGENRQETSLDQEWESKGVIPQGGLSVSTQPLTPITVIPDRSPYDQGLEELAMAQDLVKKGNMEAASDIALQSYDELSAVHMPRRNNANKKKRQKLRDDRHLAATVYIDSKRRLYSRVREEKRGTKRAEEEGRERLGDLRDVSQNYPELNKKVSSALEAYAVEPSSPTVKS